MSTMSDTSTRTARPAPVDVMPRSGLLAGRRTTAVLLVIAPLGEIVEAALSPLAGGDTGPDITAIAAHQHQFVISVAVGLTSTLLVIPAFIGLLEICRLRSPRWSRLAGWLMIMAMSGFMGVRGSQAIELQLARSGLPAAQAAAFLDRGFATPIGLIVIVAFLGGSILGLIAVCVAVWRAGLPRPAALLLAVFQPVDFLAKSPWGTALSHTVLLVGLTWIAVCLWRGRLRPRNDEVSTSTA